MIKRPSFPVYRAPMPVSRRSFDHRLTTVTVALAILVAAALLVRAVGPIAAPASDPDAYLVGP